MLRALARFILGEDRFATVDQLYEAVSSEGLKLNGRKDEYAHFLNTQTSLLYRETNREDGKHVETVNVIAFTHRGGVWVTFVDDEIVALTHNAVRRNPRKIGDIERQRLWQILLLVRVACV